MKNERYKNLSVIRDFLAEERFQDFMEDLNSDDEVIHP